MTWDRECRPACNDHKTVRMGSVLPIVLLLGWPVHWEFPVWSAWIPALQYRGRQQTIGPRTRKTALRVHDTFVQNKQTKLNQ